MNRRVIGVRAVDVHLLVAARDRLVRAVPAPASHSLKISFRNFLAGNSESLLGFPTISRWAQMFYADSLETHSKRLLVE